MKFIGRKITAGDDTVGDQLRIAREQQGLFLEDIAKEIEIKKAYLEALEKNDYSSLPEGMYKKIFLKKYSLFLGLDWKKIKKDFDASLDRLVTEKKKFSFALKKIKKSEMLIFPKIIKNVFIFLVITIFFVYIGFYIKISLSPPDIEIIEPADNLITSKNSITVIGKTDNKTVVSINNKSVLNDEDGFFKQTIDLKNGINTITIVAQKKHGPQKTIVRQVLVE